MRRGGTRNALEGEGGSGRVQRWLQKRLLAVGKAVGRQFLAGTNRRGFGGGDRRGWQGLPVTQGGEGGGRAPTSASLGGTHSESG